jgi:3-dehydroquinate synthetase
MKKDKKSVNGNTNFVLIKAIGKTVNKQISDNTVIECFKEQL